MFEYQAKLIEVVDGDTIDVTVDLGFNMRRQIRLRLTGVDTGEIYGVNHESDEYERGQEHMDYVEEWLTKAELGHGGEWPLIVRTEKKGKYGRYLAEVERRSDGSLLQSDLITNFGDVATE